MLPGGSFAGVDQEDDPQATHTKEFYYEIKDDENRYLADCATSDTKSKAAEDTRTTKVFLNHDDSTKRGKIAELLRLDASESEDE